jgi:hypothetical protein
MAVKKVLLVVPSLPVTIEQDLEALLATRLADELSNDIDMGKLARLTVSHLGIKLKQRFIDWLLADTSAPIALNEIEAAALNEIEAAA